jgi:hypothetical protein
MFYTSLDLDTPFTMGTATEQQLAWSRVFLGLNIPFFLLKVIDQDLQRTSHVLVTEIRQLLLIAQGQPNSQKLLAIGLLTPDRINKTGNYRLTWVTSIWRDRCDERVLKYRCQDGIIFVDDFYANPKRDQESREFECILSLSATVQ